AHDLAVLAGAGFGLVGIHHEIARAPIRLLRHKRPLQAGRKTGAAAAPKARGLHLFDDPVAALVDESFGSVPAAALARALEAPIEEPIKVLEDGVRVGEHFISHPIARSWGGRPARRIPGRSAGPALDSFPPRDCREVSRNSPVSDPRNSRN